MLKKYSKSRIICKPTKNIRGCRISYRNLPPKTYLQKVPSKSYLQITTPKNLFAIPNFHKFLDCRLHYVNFFRRHDRIHAVRQQKSGQIEYTTQYTSAYAHFYTNVDHRNRPWLRLLHRL
jgi:hypothetical protein